METEKSVMVVEDDPDTREALVEVLRQNGYPVVAAKNGREALDRLRAFRPCVILLDLMMPVMDGWEFRTAQQNDPALCSIAVVVLTAHADAKEEAKALQAAGYLKKPFDLDDLISVVRQHCGALGG